MKVIILILFCFISEISFANYKMDIRVLRKGGIDSGLVLASEYHYSEWVPLGQEFSVRDRAGQFVLTIKSDYVKTDAGINITNTVMINAILRTGLNKDVPLMARPIEMMIGESRELTLRLDNEREYSVLFSPRRP